MKGWSLFGSRGGGLGGTFSERGHEAVSVGSAYALAPEDIIAPMHRDIGAYFLRGLTPRRVFGNLLGKEVGVSRGRDANIHGMGDLSLGIVGYISHIPMSMPIALGVAMSMKLRNEPRVAMTYVGDGGSNAGLWHETLNMAGLYQAPLRPHRREQPVRLLNPCLATDADREYRRSRAGIRDAGRDCRRQ